jgi:hypothetical protein
LYVVADVVAGESSNITETVITPLVFDPTHPALACVLLPEASPTHIGVEPLNNKRAHSVPSDGKDTVTYAVIKTLLLELVGVIATDKPVMSVNVDVVALNTSVFVVDLT